MSHVKTIKCVIDQLEPLVKVCERLGWTFLENQKNFQWYGTWVGDTELPTDFFNSEELEYLQSLSESERLKKLTEIFGKCSHAIRVPGASYEIGVVKKGSQYHLLCDYWESGGLKENVLDQVPFLYAHEKCKWLAEQQGYTWSEKQLENGTLVMELEKW